MHTSHNNINTRALENEKKSILISKDGNVEYNNYFIFIFSRTCNIAQVKWQYRIDYRARVSYAPREETDVVRNKVNGSLLSYVTKQRGYMCEIFEKVV